MTAAFDLETTGNDPAVDRITQIGIVSADGSEWESLVNPGRPIPPAITDLTGITDAMVAGAPTFAELAPEIARRLAAPTLVGFGCLNFDVPLLAEEFERAGVSWTIPTVIDVGNAYKFCRPRTLTAAVKQYLGETHENAHTALADARATMRVLEAMAGQETVLRGLTEAGLAEFSRGDRDRAADPFGKLVYNRDGVMCFGTHRNRGVPVADDLGYAYWMLRSDFPAVTRRILQAEVDRLTAPTPSLFTEEGDDDVCF